MSLNTWISCRKQRSNLKRINSTHETAASHDDPDQSGDAQGKGLGHDACQGHGKELRCDRVLGFGVAVALGDPRRVRGLIIETVDYLFSLCT